MLNRFFKKKGAITLSPQLSEFLKNNLGINPKDKSLYVQAFRHSSKSVRQANGIQNSNERLEYLGDAVIGLIVGEFLYQNYPEKPEGELSMLRSRIVSRENLNYYGQCLDLEPLIKYQRGKAVYKSLLGNIVESLIGAIYLDLGYQKAKYIFIEKIILQYSDLKDLEMKNDDHKSQLIIYCQKNKIELDFIYLNKKNDSTERLFEMGVVMDGTRKATATGPSKREAEQQAAKKIMLSL